MIPEHLRHYATSPTPVLDDGHIMLVDVLGDEQSIVNAARVSYGAGTKRVSEDRHLIRYLMRHSHSTPFEMCEATFRIRIPMDAWRQFVRHRTLNINEYSTRYSEAIDSVQKTPEDGWRAQAVTNKQGSSGFISEDWPAAYEGTERSMAGSPGSYLSWREKEIQRLSREVYEERLTMGVAREVARKDLPLSTYTEAYVKCDLRNWLHFLSLRMDTHAQKEIRDYANAIAEIVKAWVPNVWEAFEDYDFRRSGLLLSRQEVEGLKALLRGLCSPGAIAIDAIAGALQASGLGKGREADELQAKIRRLMGS